MEEELRTTTERMAELTINNEHGPTTTTTTTTTTSEPAGNRSLSKLPLEIKQNIVHWLNLISSEDDAFDEDDSDIEEVDDLEFADSNPSQLLHPSSHKSTSLSKPAPDPSPIQTAQSVHKHISPILALSLVDRTFYDLCRPFIWEKIDFEEYTWTKLKDFREQVLVRQADYVRSLWWRASTQELEEYEPNGWDEEGTEWNAQLRTNELLEILESCKKVSQLDIDICCPTWEGWEQTGEFPAHDHPTWRFVGPVSRLSQLTSIALTATSDRPFHELFLVRLIGEMPHIESFSCSQIMACAPNIETSKSINICRSPLALHLASLSSLRSLDLDEADCFDLSWSAIEWKGRLKEIHLDDCSRASLRAIHEFCMKFSASLHSLTLDELPPYAYDMDPLRVSTDLSSGKYKFELPELRCLEIANEFPIGFLRLFEDSKKIDEIALAINAEHTAHDIENLVVKNDFGGGFPNLKKLSLSLTDSNLTDGEIEALELFYLSKGVTLEIEPDDVDVDDSDDDDDDSDENDDGESLDYQIEAQYLQNEWEEDPDPDEDEDEDFD